MSEVTPAPRRSRWRWLRWPARLLLGLLALVVVLVLATVAYVQTPSGNARVLRFALKLAHDALAGGLEARSLQLQGGHLILRDVTLRTPDGERVAHIDEVEAQVALSGLLRRRVQVELLRLEHPEVWLVQDDHGLNVARAFAPRTPSPPSPPSSPPSLTLRLDALQIDHGAVSLTVEGEEERRFRLEGLGLHARGQYVGPTGAFQASAEAQGTVAEPVPGPLRLSAQASGEGDRLEGHLDLELSRLLLVANARQETRGSALHLERLVVPPVLAQVFVRDWPLRVPVELRGDGQLLGQGLTAHLEGGAGQARLEADLEAQLDARQLRRGHLALSRVDLAELLGRGPRTDLALVADVSGGGTSLESLTGKVDLSVPVSRIRSASVGPVEVHATASKGNFDIHQLTARLPGVSIDGKGRGTTSRVQGALDLEVKDLSALGKTFDGLLATRLPPMSGEGQLHAEVNGPLRHPGVGAEGAFTRLRVGDFRARNLRLSVHVDDTDRLLDSNAVVSADGFRLGERRMRNLTAEWITRGQALQLHAGVEGAVELQLDLGGTLDADRRGLEMESLSLRYPEATWKMEQPAHLRLADGVALEPVHLVSDAQSLTLAGWMRGNRFDATLSVHDLDVARLPKGLLPPTPELGGMLTLDAHASGTEQDPSLEGSIDARDIQVGKVQHAFLQGTASWAHRRAVAKLSGKGLDTELTADVDLPVDSFRKRRHDPVRAKVSIPTFDVGKVLCAAVKTGLVKQGCDAEGKPQVTGSAGLEMDLSGFADAPVLKAEAKTQGLRYRDLPPTDLTIDVDAPETGHLAAAVEGTTFGGKVDVKATLGHSLAQILSAPKPGEVVKSSTLSSQIQIAGLQLEPLHRIDLVDREISGSVDLNGTLGGTVAAPTGELHLLAHQVQTPPMQPTELAVNVQAQSKVLIDLRAQDASGPLVQLQAQVGASPGSLQKRTSYDDVPFQLEGTIGPVDLSKLPITVGGEGRLARRLRGTFEGTVQGQGSLQAPVLTVRATNTHLAAGNVELGKSEMQVDYRAAKTTVSVDLESQNGGELKLDGTLSLDLSYPAIRRGIEPAKAPFEATLVSKNFDLAFTTGFTAAVRELGGILEIDAHATGTLASPSGQGTVEWKDGRLWLAGYGQYRRVHLLVHASNDRIAIDDLEAHTDTGTLKLTASGDRQGDTWALKAKLDVTNFPIFVDDQLVATAVLRADAVGKANSKAITLDPIQIPEAHFELPAQSRRDLQSLSRPDDIILVKNGAPLDPKRARAVLARDPGLAAAFGGLVPPPPREKPFAAILVFDAPRNLWLKSPDLNLEVGLGSDFRLEISDPTTIFGEVKVLRGRLDVLGRRFDIQRNSVVRFTGPPSEPALDVTAIYTNVREQVKVSIHVEGQGKNISLIPSSEPPLSESEIYTLLATGRTSLKRGGGTSEVGSAAAVSVLGTLAANQLKGAVNSKVGLDVLSVEAGDNGSLQGATLEAGKYVTDQLYLGYAGKVGADPSKYENSNAFRLEYQFLPRWSLEAVYGDAKSGSADIVWSRDY